MPTDYAGRPFDGGCTGFPDRLGSLDFTACCVAHDMGGTDQALFQCLNDVAPALAPVFGVCIVLMIVARPFYMWMQDRGWVK